MQMSAAQKAWATRRAKAAALGQPLAVNGFSKGSGCYQCRCCARMTRDDHQGDSCGVGLCTSCFELGGLYNVLQDGGTLELDDISNIEGEIAFIKSKGGNVATWIKDFAAMGVDVAEAMKSPVKFQKFRVVLGDLKARIHYSRGVLVNGRDCITLYAKDYSNDLGKIAAAVEGMEYQNDTDSMSDYFDQGRARIYPDSPLWALALAQCK
jgi:hypothetical protein